MGRDEVEQAVQRLGTRDLTLHPDRRKNWDLDLFLREVEGRVPRDAPVLDAGCASNPLLFDLARLGYTDLTGIDFALGDMSHLVSPAIRYVEGDLMDSPFEDRAFEAVTCLSVIEHGCPPDRFFAEMARILRPGGILLVSTDYWRLPVLTRTVPKSRTFGLPWKVYTPRRLEALRKEAERHGFTSPAWDYTTRERVVDWNRRRYTFFAFGLVRS